MLSSLDMDIYTANIHVARFFQSVLNNLLQRIDNSPCNVDLGPQGALLLKWTLDVNHIDEGKKRFWTVNPKS